MNIHLRLNYLMKITTTTIFERKHMKPDPICYIIDYRYHIRVLKQMDHLK